MAEAGPVGIVGGLLVNVSPYGMLIESPVPMVLEAVHRFRLVIQRAQSDVLARVAACWPGEGDAGFQVGLEFVDMSDVVRARLAEVLRSPPSNA
jgi:hypothetical protein